jgi:hypothetical protein
MSEEFKIIDTQEAFDAAIKARLERNTRSVTEEVTKSMKDGFLPKRQRSPPIRSILSTKSSRQTKPQLQILLRRTLHTRSAR